MRKEDLRIVFMGTPEFAVETLKCLVDNKFNVVAVVTQPDKPVGRHGSVLQPSPVKQFAVSCNIPVLQPEKLKDPLFVEELRSYNANIQVVVAFRMLPEVVWNMPEYGTFNVHAALLPQYRGAAPINWAIINGETRTGVTTFFLDHDIDTGRVIMQKTFDVADDFDVEDVYNGLMHLGASICLETLDAVILADGCPQSVPQEEMVISELRHAPKIFKETCLIDWSLPQKNIYDFVRGLSPVPGAWTTLVAPDGKETVLKVYKTRKTDFSCNGLSNGSLLIENRKLHVVTGDKAMLEIVELQLAGKKRMSASDFLNGIKDINTYCVK